MIENISLSKDTSTVWVVVDLSCCCWRSFPL